MSEIPDSVDRAFLMLYYIDYEVQMDQFEHRWGKFTSDTFLRVVKEGQGEDKIIALFALGGVDQPEIRELLLSFLASTDPQERWASAISLGEMGEEQALPFLQEMLTEFLPTVEEMKEWSELIYDWWRVRIASQLGEWQNLTTIPALRRALLRIWEVVEKTEKGDKRMWFRFQDEIAYALGRMKAFGALTGLPLPDYGMRIAIIYLAYGSFDAKKTYRYLFMAIFTNEELQREVATVLEQKFGLSEEERRYSLKMYGYDYDEREANHLKMNSRL